MIKTLIHSSYVIPQCLLVSYVNKPQFSTVVSIRELFSSFSERRCPTHKGKHVPEKGSTTEQTGSGGNFQGLRLVALRLRFEYRPGHRFPCFVYWPRPLLFLHFIPADDIERMVT